MDRIFSFFNLLKIISDIDSFRKWISDYHQIKDDSHLLEGYIFFVEVLINDLIESFCLSSAFDLEEDHVYSRARFVGVYIDDIPNTCEKVIFIKNIWNKFRLIEKQSSWKTTKNYWDSVDDLFHTFYLIYDKFTIAAKNTDKDFALKVASIFYTYIFLNDTSRGQPHTYPSIILKNNQTHTNLDKSYIGYVLCLQYVWYVLLGEDDFEKSSLKALHQASDTYSNKIPKKRPIFHFGTKRFDERQYPSLIKWKSLDCFFPIVKSEIIEPLEKEIYEGVFRDGLLIIKRPFEKSNLSNLLLVNNIHNPDYIQNDSTSELKTKRLDYYFLWERFFKIDCNQIVLDGATPFINLLIGAVGKNRYCNNDWRIEILRIKHPAIGKSKFDYTYAILIESSSNISDYSVWYVFFDCATDYSGFGGSIHHNIELFLEKYETEKVINVREIIVNKDFFEKYIDQGILSTITRIRNEAEGVFENAKGTPLENIAYEVNKEIKQWGIGSQDDLRTNIDNLLFVLKSNIPRNPENEIIFEKIKEIELTKDITKHYSIISLIIPLMIKLNMNDKLDTIDKKIDLIELKIDDLSTSKAVLDFIIESLEIFKKEIPELNNQINDVLMNISDNSKSTEQKLKISIPIIPTLVVYEIEKDVSELISKRIRQLDKLKIELREQYKW